MSSATVMSGTVAPSSSYWMKVFAICLIGWTFSSMDQSFFGYAVPSILEEFGVGLVTIGNILSAAFVLAAFSVVAIGVLADRYGRRVMFAICLGVSALLAGLQGFATSLEALAILRCVSFGVATGLVPVTNALVVEAAPSRLRGMLCGILQCGYPIGWFLASLAAAPLMTLGGWRYTFLPALLIAPLALVLAWFLPESRRFRTAKSRGREDAAHGAVDLTEPARPRIALLFGAEYRRRTLLCWLAFFLYGGAYAGTAFYFPTFFQEVRGYSPQDATMIVGLSYGIGFVGYIAAAYVGEYVTTRRNTIVIWTWVGAAAVLGVLYNDGGFISNLIWFGLTAMFFYGNAAVLTTFAAEIFPTRVRATAVAIAAGVGINLGFAIFPLLVAALVESIGWTLAFAICVVPPLFLTGLVTLGQPNIRSGEDLDSVAAVRTNETMEPQRT